MSQEEIATKVKEAVEEDPNGDNIQNISLFGSFLHGTEKADSDVDLFFEMNKTMSLFEILDVQFSLEKKLGRKVDFVEKGSLDKYIKEDVLSDAKVIYRSPRLTGSR